MKSKMISAAALAAAITFGAPAVASAAPDYYSSYSSESVTATNGQTATASASASADSNGNCTVNGEAAPCDVTPAPAASSYSSYSSYSFSFGGWSGWSF